ncbi:hypothetical protein RUND412_004705 [Rhizina undulata]
MKPIGRIVATKKSTPENFRHIDHFTTEYLSKLWKIYTVNRDVLDKGPRLENLFWRIWGSERINRSLSGQKVATLCKMIFEGEDRYEIPQRRRILMPPVAPKEATTPRLSLEIECPPTPPPSPIPPNSGCKTGSYLARIPSQVAIAAQLHKAFPPPPPSPPGPSVVRRNAALKTQKHVNNAAPAMAQLSEMQAAVPRSRAPRANHTSPAVMFGSKNNTCITKEKTPSITSKYSFEDDGESSSNAPREKADRPICARRKRPGIVKSTKVKRTRSAVAGPSRKASSSTNTAVNTATSSPSNTKTGDIVSSIPDSGNGEKQGASPSASGEWEADDGDDEDKADNNNEESSGWIVDPDFRTKYLERKRKEKLVALTSLTTASKTAAPTTAVADSIATVKSTRKKNVLVVDDIVPLKCLNEEDGTFPTAKVALENLKEEDIDELPTNLVRQKSELTLLFESEKMAAKDKTRGDGSSKRKGKSVARDSSR